MNTDVITSVEFSDESAEMLSRIASHRSKPGDKILVLTDSRTNAYEWAKRNHVNRAEVLSVLTTEDLRGVKTLHYPRVRVDTFRLNPNARTLDDFLAYRDAQCRR